MLNPIAQYACRGAAEPGLAAEIPMDEGAESAGDLDSLGSSGTRDGEGGGRGKGQKRTIAVCCRSD